MAFDVFVHRGNAFYAMFAEIQATVTDQAGALQEVRDNNRLKYVQLELPLEPAIEIVTSLPIT